METKWGKHLRIKAEEAAKDAADPKRVWLRAALSWEGMGIAGQAVSARLQSRIYGFGLTPAAADAVAEEVISIQADNRLERDRTAKVRSVAENAQLANLPPAPRGSGYSDPSGDTHHDLAVWSRESYAAGDSISDGE